MANGPPVTELLRAWGRRDRAALEAPIPVVEAQLRRPARIYRLWLHRPLDGVAS